MDTALTPAWLTPTPSEPQRRSRDVRKLEHAIFEQAFDHVIEQMTGGRFLRSVLQGYPGLSCADKDDFDKMLGRFRNWMEADPDRAREFWKARALGVDARVEHIMDRERMMDSALPDDVNLMRLEFEKVKWDAGNMNRRRYGATQQIEINQSISITAALAQAAGRLIEHEATRQIEESE